MEWRLMGVGDYSSKKKMMLWRSKDKQQINSRMSVSDLGECQKVEGLFWKCIFANEAMWLGHWFEEEEISNIISNQCIRGIFGEKSD